VDSGQVCVIEYADEVSLGRIVQRVDRRGLEPIVFHPERDPFHQPL